MEKRWRDHKITFFYKICNYLAPACLTSLILQQVNAISRYNLRNSNGIQTIGAKTSLCYNSSLPSTIREWNNLPAEAKQNYLVKLLQTLPEEKDKQSVPKYYYYGNRKTQILHMRLRTGWSSLNLDFFFLKNISDSPMCCCGSTENAQHYLFHCINFQVHRDTHFNAVSVYQSPTLNLLLYGDPALWHEIRENISKHVYELILNTS